MSNRTIKLKELQAFIDDRSSGAPQAEDLTVGELLDFLKHSAVQPQEGNTGMIMSIQKACKQYELCMSISSTGLRLAPYPPVESA